VKPIAVSIIVLVAVLVLLTREEPDPMTCMVHPAIAEHLEGRE